VTRRTRAAGAALVGAAVAAPAHAHTLPVGDFYAGLLQAALHLPALLLVLAVVLAATQLAGRARALLPLAFCAGSLAGALAVVLGAALPAAGPLARTGSAALGLAVALRRVPTGAAGAALAGLLGSAHGADALAAEPALARPVLYALGVACAPLPLVGAFQALCESVRAFWLEVAVRVAGSWIAAIAVLAGALELAR
jgi:hydrogenase/urease accessory protein HupE